MMLTQRYQIQQNSDILFSYKILRFITQPLGTACFHMSQGFQYLEHWVYVYHELWIMYTTFMLLMIY